MQEGDLALLIAVVGFVVLWLYVQADVWLNRWILRYILRDTAYFELYRAFRDDFVFYKPIDVLCLLRQADRFVKTLQKQNGTRTLAEPT